MQALYLVAVLLVFAAACKPIAKQEPVSSERWTPVVAKVLHKLLAALKVSNFQQAQLLLANPHIHLSSVGDVVGESLARGYSKKLKAFIENYRPPLPAPDVTASAIKQLQNNTDADTIVISLVKLREVASSTSNDFRRWHTIIKKSDLRLTYGEKIYQQQLNRLQTEFNGWAKPLWQQIDGEVEKFLQKMDSDALTYTTISENSRLDDMRTVAELTNERDAIEKFLTTAFN